MIKIFFTILLSFAFSQTELTTKVYNLYMSFPEDQIVSLDLNAITGYDLDNPILFMKAIDVETFDNNDFITVKYREQYQNSLGNTTTSMRPFFVINILTPIIGSL